MVNFHLIIEFSDPEDSFGGGHLYLYNFSFREDSYDSARRWEVELVFLGKVSVHGGRHHPNGTATL